MLWGICANILLSFIRPWLVETLSFWPVFAPPVLISSTLLISLQLEHGLLSQLIEKCADKDRNTRKFACFAVRIFE